MNAGQSPDFVVIDDDPVNNKICERCVQIRFPNAQVRTFTDPAEGVVFLQAEYGGNSKRHAVLFLDINMPGLSGWDVLDQIAATDDNTRVYVKTFILSSSVAEEDKQRAYSNPLVSGFVEKPITLHFRTLFPG